MALRGTWPSLSPPSRSLPASPCTWLAQACNREGITFIGPTVEVMNKFADKTAARTEAIKAGVPVVPGTDSSITDVKQLEDFVAENGLPDTHLTLTITPTPTPTPTPTLTQPQP